MAEAMRRISTAALLASAVAAAPALGAGSTPATGTTPTTTTPTAPVLAPAKPKYVKLSNETTFSRWEYTNGSDVDWVQIRIPGRPNGRKGWVPREGLGEFHLIHTQLVVDRRKLRA